MIGCPRPNWNASAHETLWGWSRKSWRAWACWVIHSLPHTVLWHAVSKTIKPAIEPPANMTSWKTALESIMKVKNGGVSGGSLGSWCWTAPSSWLMVKRTFFDGTFFAPSEKVELDPLDLPLLPPLADFEQVASPAQCPSSPQAAQWVFFFLSATFRFPLNLRPKVSACSFFAVTVKTSATSPKSTSGSSCS